MYTVIDQPEGQPEFEMTETIKSIKEFDHISMIFHSEMIIFNQTIYFKEYAGKVIIKTESEIKGKEIMMKSMFTIMELFGGMFKNQEVKNNEALLEDIESNKIDYFPAPIEINDDNNVIE